MNKTELVELTAAKAKVSKTVAEGVVDAALEVVKGALKKGDDVRVIGFGTLAIRKRNARTGVNPLTKKPMKIAASKTVGFKVSKALKASVNKK